MSDSLAVLPPHQNPPPRRVMVCHHPRVPVSEPLAETIAGFLSARLGQGVSRASLEDDAAHSRIPEQDLLIVLGGDGSMLRGGRLTAPHRVPVLGVDLGRLGFLVETQPDEWPAVLERVLAGDYWLEERMLLSVVHRRSGQVLGSHEALNEAVIGRGGVARPVHLQTMIDGGELTTYVADGLIVATPTGSTAYALAVGGPILPPELRNILLIPIAPHLSMDRAIVLAQGASVEVTARTDHQAVLSIDGQIQVPLLDGDHVRVRMSRHSARFVRVRPPAYFYVNLMARMRKNPAAGQ